MAGVRAQTTVLVVDTLWPSAFAAWRIETNEAFFLEYDSDVLVPNRIESWAGIEFSIDFRRTQRVVDWNMFDILVFDPRFADLQRYNDADFDGLQFVNVLHQRFSYMLRRKTRRGSLTWNYDAVYHLFATTTLPWVDPRRQWVHIYPSAGTFLSFHEATNFFASQYYFLDSMTAHNRSVVPVFGVPLVGRTPKAGVCFARPHASYRAKQLVVAMTSINSSALKGVNFFWELCALFTQLFPHLAVQWQFFGTFGADAPNGRCNASYLFPPMAQASLNLAYADQIDIFVNPDTGITNGWPLGGESLLTGAVIFSTDVRDSNVGSGFGFVPLTDATRADNTAEFVFLETLQPNITVPVFLPPNITRAALQLAELHSDRALLESMSLRSQSRACRLFGYDSVLNKMFQAIDKQVWRLGKNLDAVGLCGSNLTAV